MKTLNDLFNDLIFLNELGGNPRLAYEFTDPDGIRSGKSGYSFGACQFDVQNNADALSCLIDCGFTGAQIKDLVNQSITPPTVKALSEKLKKNKDIVDSWSARQLSFCLQKALSFAVAHGIAVESPSGVLALADYINQYGNLGDGAATYFLGINREIAAGDVLAFKLGHTAWGKKRPDDCQRRHDNVITVLAEEAL